MKIFTFLIIVVSILVVALPVSVESGLPKIAVWDLSAGNIPSTHAQGLTAILVSEITKLKKYEVYSQENIRTLAGWTEQRMKLGCTDTQCLTALGHMDINKLISGRVDKIGNIYSISLNLFDTQNTKSENAVSEFCRSEDELIGVVQQSVRKLFGLAEVVSTPPVSSPSVEPVKKEMPTKPADFAYEDRIGIVKIKPGEPIHIACWMVVEGPDASLGIDTKRGVEIAIDDKGGKIFGHNIKMTVYDTGCNAEGGQAAAYKLAADPTIVAAIGSNCSSEARPGAPILWRKGIPTVSPSNTAPFLTDPRRGTEYEGYLRTSHNDKVQGVVAAEFAIKQLRVKRAATIHDGSPYAEQLQATFVENFKKMGGIITNQEVVAPTDTNMRPVMTRIAVGRPELIYLPIFISAGAHITRQAKEVSGTKKAYLMGSDGIFSPDFYKAAGGAAIDMYHSSPDFSAFAGGYRDFLAKHQRKYGEMPLAPFHAHAYDAAMMVFAVIERVARKGPDGALYIGRQALRDALYSTRGFKGLTGTLNCSSYGDCADPKIAVYRTTEENVRRLVMPNTPFWRTY